MNILLTAARIGSLEVPNRIVMPAMTTRTADEEGYVTDDTIAYYLARAQGGVGLITVEMAFAGKGRPPSPPRSWALRRSFSAWPHTPGR
jgi:2,4-dienoyl-CoA reductase-like NADH-dependent reductase (Old Yellow Enzyme family)